MSTHEGVAFRSDSTSAAGRAVLADALRKADPVGARAVEHETSWRREYLRHFTRAVEAGVGDPAAARAIAEDGLRSARAAMRFDDVGLGEAIGSSPLQQVLSTSTIAGRGEPETELTLPYRGVRLRGDDLARQLDEWVERGVVTASCADAVRTVQAHPEWLRLDDEVVVVLGAGAEMGPYRALQRWGAEVVAVDQPGPSLVVVDVSLSPHGCLSRGVRGGWRAAVRPRRGRDPGRPTDGGRRPSGPAGCSPGRRPARAWCRRARRGSGR